MDTQQDTKMKWAANVLRKSAAGSPVSPSDMRKAHRILEEFERGMK